MAAEDGIRVVLTEHSPAWAELFRSQAQRIRAALGRVAVVVEHVGSTAVPGLPAKPVVDVCLGVPDPRDEPRYLTQLTRIGYRVRIREPDWFDHRLLVLSEPAVNLHVFAVGCPEIARMIRFRDRLRSHPADRYRYAAAKAALARHHWPSMQDYADAKTGTIDAIFAAAEADDPGTEQATASGPAAGGSQSTAETRLNHPACRGSPFRTYHL